MAKLGDVAFCELHEVRFGKAKLDLGQVWWVRFDEAKLGKVRFDEATLCEERFGELYFKSGEVSFGEALLVKVRIKILDGNGTRTWKG